MHLSVDSRQRRQALVAALLTTTVLGSLLAHPAPASAYAPSTDYGPGVAFLAQDHAAAMADSQAMQTVIQDGPAGPEYSRTSTSPMPAQPAHLDDLPGGTTVNKVDADGTQYYEVSDGGNLNQYLGHGPSYGEIDLPYMGPTKDGKPTAGHQLAGQYVVLRISAWDVDEICVTCKSDQIPERDTVTVNGVDIPGAYLHGSTDVDWDTDIALPANDFLFGQASGLSGKNVITVNINAGKDGKWNVDWYVKVTKIELRLPDSYSVERPTILFHGLAGTNGCKDQGDYTGITDFAQDLETHGAPSDRLFESLHDGCQ